MLKRAREEAAKQIKALRPKKSGGFKKAGMSKRSWDAAIHGLMRQKLWVSMSEVSKANPLDRELLEILLRFGMSQATGGADRAAAQADIRRAADTKKLQQHLRSKEFKLKMFTEVERWATKRVKHISADTRRMVKQSVMRLLVDAAGEIPMPSPGEMARRIRSQFHGTDPKGRIYAFSPERAAGIAIDELGEAENTGAFQTYKAAGVKRIRWLAKRDGRSGDRHHEQMHGKEVDLGDHFVTPLGNRLLYPKDPRAPIKETAR
jgi:hypothetical protein